MKKIFKKTFIIFSALFFIFGTSVKAAPMKSDFKLKVNDKNIVLTMPLLVENDRTLAPLRLIAEELGYEVFWQESTRTVDIIDGLEKIVFTIDSNKVNINGNIKEIDVNSRIYEDRTYIPIRALENLNSKIDWKNDTRTVLVNRNSEYYKETPIKEESKPEKIKSSDRSTFEYWDYYNDYDTSVIMDSNEIIAFNERNLNSRNKMKNISSMGETTDGSFLIEEMNRVAKFTNTRYNSSKKAHSSEFKEALKNNMNIPTNPNFFVKKGIINKRTIMRTYPTHEPFFKSSSSSLDYAVETAIYPWEEISIYHTSADGKWLYGEIFNCYGWVPVENVSFGSQSEIDNLIKNSEFVVITTDKVKINGVQLDMGTKVPLVSEDENSYRVLLPTNSSVLSTYEVNLKKSLGNKGYLPFTQANMIKQALKFHGEPYGWGGLNNTRDCSGLIQDVYRSFGILIPRNSGDQGNSVMGMTKSIKGMNKQDRINSLKQFGPGASLHMTGHVMMYMGVDEKGIPSIIHHYIGHYIGSKYIPANKCSITSLDIQGSNKQTYLNNSYGLKYFK